MSTLRPMNPINQEKAGPPDLSALRIQREPEKSGGGKGWIFFGAIVAVALGAGAYFYFGQGQGRSFAPQLASRKVETVTASVVSEGQASTILTATGYVEAERKADLSPKITSRITELNVTEGSRVKKGDVIARLDHTDIDAQLQDARAAWTNTKAELDRQKSLHQQGLAPKSSLDSATALEASARAKVDYVRAQLDYTEIRAPFSGVITAKRAHVGEAVSPFGSSPSGGGSGGAIVTLVEFSSLYVGADVNESNLAKLSPNQPAEITLDAVPDHTYHGYLKQIVPSADRQKGTVRVKVAFGDGDEKILPDLSSRVAFTSEQTQGKTARARVLVPKSAVAQQNGQSGVFRIVAGRAQWTPIAAGGEVQGQVEITKGLQGGEKLLVVPPDHPIRDGERVRVEGETTS
jgi:RND family efflux transporter MFP subunit